MKFDLSASLLDALENENGLLDWYSEAGSQHDASLSYEKKEAKINEKSLK